MYTNEIELTEEENVIIDNLLMLLSSRVPANVLLGIEIGQNYVEELDNMFFGNFSYFIEIFHETANIGKKDLYDPKTANVNFAYQMLKKTVEIVIV